MEYLFEMHTHTKEVSTCAVAFAEDLIESYKDSDYAGFVLTNHLNASTFERVGLENASWDEKIDHFMKGYEAVKEAAGDRFIVLLGFEINFYNTPNDYLVYGATEEFLRSNGDLMAMTPKQFSKLCRDNGILFIQAHPFRRGMKIIDWNLLDGYEIFNGNPRHNSNNDIAEISRGYTLDRIYSTDKCALKIAICEMRYFDDVPNIVAINEAMELVRKYSTPESPNFVNGILAEFKKRLEN